MFIKNVYQIDPELLNCEYPDHCSDWIANEAIEYYRRGFTIVFI